VITLETNRREQSLRFFRMVHFGGVHCDKVSNRGLPGHIMYSTYQTRRCHISYENYLHLHDCAKKWSPIFSRKLQHSKRPRTAVTRNSERAFFQQKLKKRQ